MPLMVTVAEVEFDSTSPEGRTPPTMLQVYGDFPPAVVHVVE